jgi:hypothetical protein
VAWNDSATERPAWVFATAALDKLDKLDKLDAFDAFDALDALDALDAPAVLKAEAQGGVS